MKNAFENTHCKCSLPTMSEKRKVGLANSAQKRNRITNKRTHSIHTYTQTMEKRESQRDREKWQQQHISMLHLKNLFFFVDCKNRREFSIALDSNTLLYAVQFDDNVICVYVNGLWSLFSVQQTKCCCSLIRSLFSCYIVRTMHNQQCPTTGP